MKEQARNVRSDLLLGDVELGGGVSGILAAANAVDLVVDRGTVMVTHLTSTGNSPLDVGRMPGTDTSDLAQTLVRLARELLGAPAGGDTVETVALGDGNDVDHLVGLEDGGDLDGLLEETVAESDLVGDAAAIDLDLHKVGLLLLEGSLGDLRVGEDTDDGAVLLDALELAGDGLAVVLGVLLGVLGEGLLLALVPVLVEAALDLVAQVLGPDSGEGAQAAGGLDVANQADSDHLKFTKLVLHPDSARAARDSYRRGLDDGASLDNFLLVQLGTRTVQVTDNGGHAGLVAHGGSQVHRLLRVILGEALDFAPTSTSVAVGLCEI